MKVVCLRVFAACLLLAPLCAAAPGQGGRAARGEGFGRRGGKYDPTGLSSGAVLVHENDMEGCLVVAKDGAEPSKVLLVETLSHDRFLKYAAEGFAANGFGRLGVEAVYLHAPFPGVTRR